MKRMLAFFLVLIGALLLCPVPAQAVPQQIVLTVDGRQLSIPAAYGAPFLDENGRTQIPLRYVLEQCGYAVYWDQSARSASVPTDRGEIVVTVGSASLHTPDGTVAMDTYARQSADARVYIPLRPVLEALGLRIGWQRDGAVDQIDISGALGQTALYVNSVRFSKTEWAHYLEYLRLEWDIDDTLFADDPEGGAEKNLALQQQAARDLQRIACLQLLCRDKQCAPSPAEWDELIRQKASMLAALGGEEAWNEILAATGTTPYVYDLYTESQLYLDHLYAAFGAEEGERLLQACIDQSDLHTTVWYDTVTAANCLTILAG